LPTLSSSPNNNNNNNSSSNNNQQQQTVAIAAKTTAHSSNVRGLNNNNNTNINSNSKINNETGNKAACSLLGRPRPLQPNGMPGAGKYLKEFKKLYNKNKLKYLGYDKLCKEVRDNLLRTLD